MLKNRDNLYIILFLAIAFIILLGFSILPTSQMIQLPKEAQGGYDLTEYDFEDAIYIAARVWDSWPEKLYLPEELDGAEEPVSQQGLDFTNMQYATYRLRLKLPSGVDYGITLGSPDYAMRVYINGVELGNAGIPAATREETRAQELGLTLYFTAQSETTEIVVQTANFVHRIGADVPQLTIGTGKKIAQTETVETLVTGLIFGCLITAGIYHLAIFILNRRQRATLVFGISCLLHAFVDVDFARKLFPDVNWQICIRIEYIFFILTIALFIVLINMLLPRTIHAWAVRGYLGLCGLYIAVILGSDSTFFTQFLRAYQMISIVMAVYILVRLIMRFREKTPRASLAILGVVVMVIFGVNEALWNNGIHLLEWNTGAYMGVREGMVMFVLCYALLLSIEQVEVNKRLDEAKIALAFAEDNYQKTLQKQKDAKTPQIALSDFNLTKRETEVTVLLLDGKTRDEIAHLLCISMGTVNTHCSNIYRKTGCGSAAELMRMLLPVAAPTAS